MPVVEKIKQHPKNPKQGFVRFDDGREAWTPEIALLNELVGKDLPADWLLREKDDRWQLLPPKKGGGGQAAYRNTREGMLYEEERKDRRTAAMTVMEGMNGEWDELLADAVYSWLRQGSQSGSGTGEGSKGSQAESRRGGDGQSAASPPPPSPTKQVEAVVDDISPTFEELVARIGSAAEVRELMNATVGTEYTPANIRKSTPMERAATLEAFRTGDK